MSICQPEVPSCGSERSSSAPRPNMPSASRTGTRMSKRSSQRSSGNCRRSRPRRVRGRAPPRIPSACIVDLSPWRLSVPIEPAAFQISDSFRPGRNAPASGYAWARHDRVKAAHGNRDQVHLPPPDGKQRTKSEFRFPGTKKGPFDRRAPGDGGGPARSTAGPGPRRAGASLRPGRPSGAVPRCARRAAGGS